ncbi:HPr kinase [Aliidongia dinghuensis]|uniref:3-oxo-tetronate kinase n=1 Tax=Aliidongia dinghuensis TaxID=1867774 RepID=A0A8J2YPB7_9PROT|nr:3-oxo-tetronate kinase [Aliidongia dinghuensis]GGF02440.1 HPr kinase [Aliidongia dinghuensis]
MAILLGAIADDFTGATDLANTLVRQGMRTVQLIDVPTEPFERMDLDEVDAIVVALKSRTIPAADAIDQSLAALGWLEAAGARQILFKYCSTFDSTPAGNIGPVAEALMTAMGVDFTIYCPAFPENGRTIFKGYLFVGDGLLSESGMRDHPLTPMRDSNLVRVLAQQTTRPVGLVPLSAVSAGPGAVRVVFDRLRGAGTAHAIVDAASDDDLIRLGEAAAQLRLITGGSGLALGLPANFRRQGLLADHGMDAAMAVDLGGASAVLSGSCSVATLAQNAYMRARRPSFQLDPLALATGDDQIDDALDWAERHLGPAPILISASAAPADVRAAQEALGRERAGTVVEEALARIAAGLVERGVRRLVVAGGESSGAVVKALGITALGIGRQIDPGVPWTVASGGDRPPLALALKSGNFGGEDFFLRAFA